ncbi:MAG: TIGR03808 family TAT-translocated repetitive protein [Xanthobacteraceae bacterium]|jgi:uncharacterized secreted repeat protein (TIGR03808 family)
MSLDRRRLFAALAGAGAASAGNAAGEAQALPARELGLRAEIDAVSLGIRPNAAEDQTQNLQRAIDQAAAARAVLRLPPGVYRAGGLTLPPYAAIAGVAGATRIVMAGGPSMMSATGGDHIGVSGLVLDGGNIPLPERRGLLHFAQGRSLRIADCEIINAGRNGISLEAIDGEVTANTISAADSAIFSLDSRGLKIAGNTVRGAGNGGILVWRSERGDDGTLVIDNRIDGILNKAGGSGQYGNAINVFRADNVIVRGNRIRNAAFSAVRGNAASNLLIVGNTCTGLGEVGLYAEFGFEGALIANNIVDGAAVGVSVTNFNQGGRLAIVQGNLIRNLVGRRPPGTDPNDIAGVGIGVEADTSVTGNVVENAANAGIAAGWGAYLRDVAISSNVIRHADFGITVSVAPGAGAAVIADNMISDVRSGAIVGMEWKKPVTGDLSKDGAARYAQLSIGGNRVR